MVQKKKVQEEIPFDEGMDKLEAIVQQLEQGELSLEKSLALFEEGMGLAAMLDARLGSAEMKVEQLLAGTEGGLETMPFDETDEDGGEG